MMLPYQRPAESESNHDHLSRDGSNLRASRKDSEHRRGDVIIYTNEGIVTQGTILWVAAPGEIAGKQHPMRYIVEPDGETDTFPHLVYPGEVIRLAAVQEPVLVKCPYCTGRHLESQIEYCLFNPNKPEI